MKAHRVKDVLLFIDNFKTGKLMGHQPARRSGYAKWYLEELKKDGRKLPNVI